MIFFKYYFVAYTLQIYQKRVLKYYDLFLSKVDQGH